MKQAAINPLPVPTPYHPLWADGAEGEITLQGSGIYFSWILRLHGRVSTRGSYFSPAPAAGTRDLGWARTPFLSPFSSEFSPILATFLPAAPSTRPTASRGYRAVAMLLRLKSNQITLIT